MKKLSIVEFILGLIFSVIAIILSLTNNDFSQSKLDSFICVLRCHIFEFTIISIICFLSAFFIHWRKKIFKPYNLLILIPFFLVFFANIFPLLSDTAKNRAKYFIEDYAKLENQILFSNKASKAINDRLYKDAILHLNDAIDCAPRHPNSYELREYIDIIEKDTRIAQVLFECINKKKNNRHNGVLYSHINKLHSIDYDYGRYHNAFVDTLKKAHMDFNLFYDACNKYKQTSQCDSTTLKEILSYYKSFNWFCFEESYYTMQEPNNDNFYETISNNIVSDDLSSWQKRFTYKWGQ